LDSYHNRTEKSLWEWGNGLPKIEPNVPMPKVMPPKKDDDLANYSQKELKELLEKFEQQWTEEDDLKHDHMKPFHFLDWLEQND